MRISGVLPTAPPAPCFVHICIEQTITDFSGDVKGHEDQHTPPYSQRVNSASQTVSTRLPRLYQACWGGANLVFFMAMFRIYRHSINSRCLYWNWYYEFAAATHDCRSRRPMRTVNHHLLSRLPFIYVLSIWRSLHYPSMLADIRYHQTGQPPYNSVWVLS